MGKDLDLFQELKGNLLCLKARLAGKGGFLLQLSHKESEQTETRSTLTDLELVLPFLLKYDASGIIPR